MKRCLIVLLVLLLAAAWSTGCPKRRAPDQAGPGKAKEGAAQKKKKQMERELEAIEQHAAQCPRELEVVLGKLRDFEGRTKDRYLLQKAERVRERAHELFDLEAKSISQKLLREAKEITEGGHFERALRKLEKFPKIFLQTKWAKSIEAERDRIHVLKDARLQYNEILDKLAKFKEMNEYDMALGVIESFGLIEKFKDSGWGEELEKEIEEIQKLRKEQLAKKAAEAKFRWEAIFNKKDLYNWDLRDPEAFAIQDQTLVVNGDKKNQDNNEAFARVGEDNWEDYIVLLQFKIVRGEGFHLAVRGKIEGGRRQFVMVPFMSYDFDMGRWQRVKVDVRGKEVNWVRLGEFAQGSEEAKYPIGSMGIIADPGNEIHFKAIRIKILKKGPPVKKEAEKG
jgi:hypothetical protein